MELLLKRDGISCSPTGIYGIIRTESERTRPSLTRLLMISVNKKPSIKNDYFGSDKKRVLYYNVNEIRFAGPDFINLQGIRRVFTTLFKIIKLI